MATETHEIDAVVFGGGIAGLWLLDELRRAGYQAVLLESAALGAGQTIWSQGIIHGGLKYTLDGLMNASAAAISDMPAFWSECLAGKREPDLSAAVMKSPCCYLWRTDSMSSKLGMIGARVGLRTSSEAVAGDERPAALAGCPGTVARVAEPVIDTASVLAALARRNEPCIAAYDATRLDVKRSGLRGWDIGVVDPGTGRRITLRATQRVFLTAGNGNSTLSAQFGLPDARESMQVRPLRMVMVRGDAERLPELYGHCVDGARTRVTITSATDSAGRRVWQVGGEIAERGVAMGEAELIAVAKRELASVLPGFSAESCEYATYDAPRAEIQNKGKRPESSGWVEYMGVVRAWPTKLVLAPQLARELTATLAPERAACPDVGAVLAGWTRPSVAAYPWENARWTLG